ncbi:uncharacterized protein LOC127704452 isoform X1 [Mytilus californianus]|uniref:uncharacterized protein LOC127704452 isoform X1 n=1 Tax=Mytilus californianus TaxID=6549 RepID=UPI002246162B|nr:uncharacterized protein LOC127704452 isoform X1 [Mytilus californianus]
MAQSSTYSHIPLNEHRSQSYPTTEVQTDEPDNSPTYHEEDGDKQPSHTLLENQQFTKPESSSVYNIVTSMVNPEVDTPPQYTSVDPMCVVTDISPTYNSVPVNVDQPTSSTSIDPCVSENQTVKISTAKRQWIDENPPDNSDYLCLAIFVCCCCCWPFGLIAIYMANKGSKARARRDYHTARRYNKMAYTWIRLAVCFGIFSIICSLIIPAIFFLRLIYYGEVFGDFSRYKATNSSVFV